MNTEDLKVKQLYITDEGTIAEEDTDILKPEPVMYDNLSKIDLVRLCKEKDSALTSYEAERKTRQESHNKELENMNEFYVNKIKTLNGLIKYYERKYKLIKDIIDIEKEEKPNDTVQ